jgi:four helix bundle protein
MNITDLKVYNIAIELEGYIFQLINKIPDKWKIDQVKQIERSSASISTNICEGYCKRFYKKDFIRYLFISLGSSDETQHHLRVLHFKKIIDKETYDIYAGKYKNLSVRILNLINCLRKKNNL